MKHLLVMCVMKSMKKCIELETFLRNGETAQCLRTLVCSLPKNPSLGPKIKVEWLLTACNSNARYSKFLFSTCVSTLTNLGVYTYNLAIYPYNLGVYTYQTGYPHSHMHTPTLTYTYACN